MIFKALLRLPFPALPVSILLLVAPAAAPAVVPQPDQEFLDTKIELARAEIERLVPTSRSTSGAVAALREMLEFRAETLAELEQKHKLTTLTGIETHDRFDDALVRELSRLVKNGVEAESSAPGEDDVIYFTVVMGDPPPLGKSPVAFMALQYGILAVRTVDALESDPSMSRETAEKLALRFVDSAFTLYNESHIDMQAMSFADSFRQNSVIVRLRCESDGSAYRVTGNRNKIYDDGSVATLFFLKSNATYEELVVEFPLRYLSRLSQMSDRQKNLKKKPKPLRPNTLEP
jgi:hypothetical protein